MRRLELAYLHTAQNGHRDVTFAVLSSFTVTALKSQLAEFQRRSKGMIIRFCIFIKMAKMYFYKNGTYNF